MYRRALDLRERMDSIKPIMHIFKEKNIFLISALIELTDAKASCQSRITTSIKLFDGFGRYTTNNQKDDT